MIKKFFILILLTTPLLICGREYSFIGNNSSKNVNKIMTKQLIVKKVISKVLSPDATQIDSLLDNANVCYNPIDVVNWQDYDYEANVKFRMAYSDTEIYLQFLVKERDLKAVYDKDSLSRPYTDSCCEFFLSPYPADSLNNSYFNLEINCIGIGTFAYHSPNEQTMHFGSDIMSQIRRTSSLGNKALGIINGKENENFEWKLTIAIPLSLYNLDNISGLDKISGQTFRGNFYKCGDDMPKRHYLSWNPIGTPKPNFHTPQFFGNIYFEK